jgi:hypothetical protein
MYFSFSHPQWNTNSELRTVSELGLQMELQLELRLRTVSELGLQMELQLA